MLRVDITLFFSDAYTYADLWCCSMLLLAFDLLALSHVPICAMSGVDALMFGAHPQVMSS